MLLKFVLVLLLTLLYILVHRWISRLILGSRAAAAEARPTRTLFVRKVASISLATIYLVGLGLVLGINYGEITIFLSSAFAVLGIALFAQWSILSNLTASLIIFFGFPYRIGDEIRVLDKDDTVTGIIEEISLFSVQIRDRAGNLATFPNNLFLQRPVVKIETAEPEGRSVPFQE